MTSNMSGNKGEWSELYTFLKLLGQGRIYAANEKVEKIGSIYYPILKIIREETAGNRIDYVIDNDKVHLEIENTNVLSVDRAELDERADYLLEKILNGSNSFEIEEITRYVNGIKVTKIKAPSSDTTDIKMQIEDIYTGFKNDIGFSIKSEIGNPPTLLNAGETTNIIYKVTGLTDSQMEAVNSIVDGNKIKARIAKIREYGGNFTYADISHKGFKRNLIMIDSLMPQLIGHMVLYHYIGDERSCTDLINELGRRDPLGFGEEIIYSYKIKKFLCSCALGMKPARKWDGIDEANGGYIIVKADGEILAYHIYNRNMFEQYLLDNTCLERASTSRHKYMKLYKEGDDMFIKLNLQIRFSR